MHGGQQQLPADWTDTTMDESRQIELVDQIVERVRRWGVAGVTSTLLDAARPLALIGGQLLWVAQPALSLIAGADQVSEYARLLEQPEALDLLQTRLDER